LGVLRKSDGRYPLPKKCRVLVAARNRYSSVRRCCAAKRLRFCRVFGNTFDIGVGEQRTVLTYWRIRGNPVRSNSASCKSCIT
jgi:hypothetical protein